MNSQKQAVALIVILLVFACTSLHAAVPNLINFQGLLSDSSGNPVTGTVDLTFSIYEDSLTPTALWTETHFAVTLDNGFIDVVLGDLNPMPMDVWYGTQSWLGITVNTDPEITPRTRLLSVPYSLRAEGVDGHVKTDVAELFILGQPSNPPQLYIEDDASVTPTVEEYIRITDLSVALVVDRNAGDVDWSVLEADKLTIWHTDGSIGSKMDQRSLELTSSDAPVTPPIPLPPAPEPYLYIADDVFGQIFASLTQAGELKTQCVTCSTITEILPNQIFFIKNTDTAKIELLGDNSLRLAPPLESDGLNLGGIVTFENEAIFSIKTTHPESSFSDYIGITGTLTIDGNGVTVTDTSSGGILTVTANDLTVENPAGDLTVSGGELLLEPSGGGFGPRVILTEERCRLTSNVDADSLTLHRTDGLVLVLGASGTSAVYTAGGVQITGPTARQFAANPNSIRLTRPSTNYAVVYDLEDATDLHYCDLDDDGLRDIRYQHTPTKELVLESGTSLRCDGPTSMTSCDVSGAATYASTVDVTGTMTCSGATILTTCDVSGAATFGSAVEIGGPTGIPPGSFLHVNGDITATGAKLFVEDHPTDATKEIAYVALEGNEAGTYTRGSSQLKNGVAEIILPEDFHLVTNAEGLTAQITPRGPVQSMLYVESITPTMLVVKASNKKDGSVKFDFMVNGLRLGFENHQVIRDKKSVAMID